MEISKTKVTLFILLVIALISCVIGYINLQHKYIVKLPKNNMTIEYQTDKYENTQTTSVVDIPEARSILEGGPFYFGENIMLSSGTIINVENKGYIDDIKNGRVNVDFLGHDYVDRTKYIALYVTVYNNKNSIISFSKEDFEIGFWEEKDVLRKRYFNIETLENIKGIFSMTDISPFTKREGYVFIPIKDSKMDNFYFKFTVEGIPVVFRK